MEEGMGLLKEQVIDLTALRCRANVAHIRQPLPVSGLSFQGQSQPRAPGTRLTETFLMSEVPLQSDSNTRARGGPVSRRCRANVAYIRQSMPVSGLGFQIKVRTALSSGTRLAGIPPPPHPGMVKGSVFKGCGSERGHGVWW